MGKKSRKKKEKVTRTSKKLEKVEETQPIGIGNTEIVEFVYSEKALVYHRFVDPTSYIPASFITNSLALCVEKWNPYLPNLRMSDLHAEAVPSMPDHGTFRDWGGIIQVDLIDPSRGLCVELSSLRQEVLESELALGRRKGETELLVQAAMEEAMAKLGEVVSKATKNQVKINKQIQEALSKQVRINEELKLDLSKQVRINEELESKISSLEGEITHMKESMDIFKNDIYKESLLLNKEMKGLKSLANHVRRHIALEKARSKIRTGLDKRDLKAGEKWMTYFDEFSNDDWSQIFIIEDHGLVHDVKQLLRKGSLDANLHIHNMDPVDVFVGIMADDVHSSRGACCGYTTMPFPTHRGLLDSRFVSRFHCFSVSRFVSRFHCFSVSRFVSRFHCFELHLQHVMWSKVILKACFNQKSVCCLHSHDS